MPLLVGMLLLLPLYPLLETWPGDPAGLFGRDRFHGVHRTWCSCCWGSVVAGLCIAIPTATLTTLGYGDIHPVSRFAQWFSVTEGILFVAVIIESLLLTQMRRAAREGIEIGAAQPGRRPEWRWRNQSDVW